MKCCGRNKAKTHWLLLVALAGPLQAAPNVQGIALNCVNCHAGSAESGVPSLQGLTAERLNARLLDFKYQRTPNTLMTRLVKGYDDTTLQALADYLTQVQP